jgi:hypothetical protein
MKYKVGDKAIIIGNKSKHPFLLFEKVIIEEIYNSDYWAKCKNISGYVSDDDLANDDTFNTDITLAIRHYCNNKDVNLSADRISDFIGHAKRLELEELASELEDLKNLIK